VRWDGEESLKGLKILLFANTEWYLYNFRLALARALRDRGADVLLASPAGAYGPKLREEGFRWIPLPMVRRSLNPLRELRLLAHLIRLYRAEQVDIVHHFTIKCVIYGSLAARLAGVSRRINAVTGMGYIFASRHLFALLLRPVVTLLLKLALGGKTTRLIVQNSDDRSIFQESGLVSPEHIRLIPGSGVDTERFSPVTEATNEKRPFRVVFAARLLWDKGVGEYVSAAKALRVRRLPIEFLLAGSRDPGNPGAIPEDTLSKWQDEGLVTFLGHVDNMAHWLRHANVAVLPSYYREGIPKSLLEAAACGLPIITTNAPGCRDAVDDGVTGILIPCRDAGALAAAISFIYANPDKAREMGLAGRKKILSEFDEKLVLAQTLGVYSEVLNTAKS
jgi:glycosyltransferase involved in cell wall biosynthesis